MRRIVCLLFFCGALALASSAAAANGRVIKVLPHLLDLNGRHSLSPSLYDRDAYQALLRQHPGRRSGIAFDVQWRCRGGVYEPLKLRVELRGIARGDLPGSITLETELKPGGWFSHWSRLTLDGDAYRKIGEVTAWRATLWEGDRLLGEQQSFLW
jgi:hypothetical protein